MCPVVSSLKVQLSVTIEGAWTGPQPTFTRAIYASPKLRFRKGTGSLSNRSVHV